ncbi:MAG: homocysteine S-methyltransferase family protein, partial [Clostridia bacterium]|nr:homocysteine S-methyltransferase family protein [Clostridia bacterium]
MSKSVLEKINTELTYFDGGMGTLLQAAGLPLGELPEKWNLTHADTIQAIHENYLQAGADIIKSNTFGANALKYSKTEMEAVVTAGMRLARGAVNAYGKGYVALDICPCGKLLKPYGDLDFDRAVELFSE